MSKTRPIRNVLILVTLLGPLLGLGIAVLTIPAGPTDQVLSSGAEPDEDVKLDNHEVEARVTLLNPDLSRGELTARVVINPGSDLIATSDQSLNQTIRVRVFSDIAGITQTVFETGATVDPITTTLPLGGSRLTRYPVDSYKADLVMDVQREVDPGEGQAVKGEQEFEKVPIVATVRSSLSDLRVSGTTTPSDQNVLNANFELERPGTVVVFAIALMGLAWLLALGCVALAWGVLIQAREIPFWCWGFYAGVLFALPQLRNGLPGSPPFGSLIDWSIYYWALGMVGVSLLALILAGNVALRAAASSKRPGIEAGNITRQTNDKDGPAN